MLVKQIRLTLLTITLCTLVVPTSVSRAISFDSSGRSQQLPMKDANSYAKDACKEFAKVSNKLPTTQKELTSWLKSASKAINNALPKAASAAKRSSSWNTFLGDFMFLQGELKYMTAYRAFSNAKQWDASVTALKTTCYKLLSK